MPPTKQLYCKFYKLHTDVQTGIVSYRNENAKLTQGLL